MENHELVRDRISFPKITQKDEGQRNSTVSLGKKTRKEQ